MKKFYFLFIAFCFGICVNAQFVYFPDANFKAKLLQSDPNNIIASDSNGNYIKIDANNDGEIELNEAQVVFYLDIDNSLITDLSGIFAFENLINLSCNYNQLNSLDVHSLMNLEVLFCNNNELITLNVNSLINLRYMSCTYNNLQSLNLNSNNNLRFLYCYDNQITSLVVNDLIILNTLYCQNNLLDYISLNSLTSLESLNCSANNFTSIDVSNLTNLLQFSCEGNQLSSINLNGLTNLQHLNCNNNQLATLNISDSPNLISLNCYSNILNTLYIKNGANETCNFSNNPNLQFICADQSQVGSIESFALIFGIINCIVSSNCSLSNGNSNNLNDFNLAPNPTKEVLYIISKQNIELLSISIYNNLGQLILLIPDAKETNNIDVSTLETGNYFIKIVSEKGTKTTKFIKE